MRVVIPEDRQAYFVRETERQIIIEEYEETDDEPENEPDTSGKIIEIPATSRKALPAVRSNKIKFSRLAIFSVAGSVALVLLFFG